MTHCSGWMPSRMTRKPSIIGPRVTLRYSTTFCASTTNTNCWDKSVPTASGGSSKALYCALAGTRTRANSPGVRARSISLATSLYRAAMSGLRNAAREVQDRGTFDYLEYAMTTPELNGFMQG